MSGSAEFNQLSDDFLRRLGDALLPEAGLDPRHRARLQEVLRGAFLAGLRGEARREFRGEFGRAALLAFDAGCLAAAAARWGG